MASCACCHCVFICWLVHFIPVPRCSGVDRQGYGSFHMGIIRAGSDDLEYKNKMLVKIQKSGKKSSDCCSFCMTVAIKKNTYLILPHTRRSRCVAPLFPPWLRGCIVVCLCMFTRNGARGFVGSWGTRGFGLWARGCLTSHVGVDILT
jgi:hypothetical protein